MKDYFFCNECYWKPEECVECTGSDETCKIRLGNLLICKKCLEKQGEAFETDKGCAIRLHIKYAEATKDIDKAFCFKCRHDLQNEILNGNPTDETKALYDALWKRIKVKDLLQKGIEPFRYGISLKKYCEETSYIEEFIEKQFPPANIKEQKLIESI